MVRAEDVVEVLRDAGCPFWKMGTKAGITSGRKIAQSSDLNQDDDSLSIDQSLDYLRQTIKRLLPGQYLLRYNSSSSLEGKGFYEEVFVVDEKGSSLPALSGAPAMNPGNIDEMVSQKVQAILDKRELEELRTRVNQLEKEQVEEPEWKKQLGHAIGTINQTAPHIWTHLIGMFFNGGNAPAVAGYPQTTYPTQPQANPNTPMAQEENTTTEVSTEEIQAELDASQDHYAQVIFELRCADANLLDDLQRLARMAKANPGQFEFMLNGLRSMQA